MGGKSSKNNVKPELTEKDIQFLMANTSYNREYVVEWFHSFIKDNPDGKLDKKEFEKLYTELYPKGDPSKFSKFVFDAFDTDGSKYITFTEFLLANSVLTDGDVKKRLRFGFEVFDSNNNNQIDIKEMTKVLEALYDLKGVPKDQRKGENSAANKAKEIFQKLDSDGSKALNCDEFVNGCLGNKYIMSLLLPDEN